MRSILLVVFLGGCAFWREPEPEPWAGKVFVGDTSRGGLFRAQGSETGPPISSTS